MRRAASVLAAVASLAILATVAPVAHANGRFPETRSVTFRKGTPTDITMGSTIGLLVSKDDGAHFYWICDQAVFGDNNNMFDPDYKVASDGTIYANTPAGLRVSRDAGCTFEVAPVEPALSQQKWVESMDLGPSDALWITQAEGGMPNDVFVSTDGGHVFQSKGLSSPAIWWKSVKVAPSNGMRAYVTGYQVTQLADDGGTVGPAVHVRRTDDGGATWKPLPTTDFAFANSPLILVVAVSPTNPDVVFAVSLSANPPMGDKLYRSTDAGMTWKLVLDTTTPVRGVVFLADGSVAVGTPAAAWRSGDGGATFQPLSGQPQEACVAQREDGTLFACGANWDPDFSALGKSAPGTVGPFLKVFRFVDMAGPLACPAGTIQHDVCELQLWPAVKEQFGIVDPTADGAPVDAAGPAKKPSGCCDSGGSSGAETAGVVVLAVLVGAWLVRRGKKQKKRKCCQ